ncbi:hypothetical protein FA13DRAFT_1709660 [Coprinellus micaceus]|uniref:Uncharacterized protein n=1 Tax=Coprinellus micaceus TaxID=71717 RepID=A0A4Y7TDZ1_COPMI|nr:hypothetical protein FA13DRAFT_1709660 [Coprinellus micaceus]
MGGVVLRVVRSAGVASFRVVDGGGKPAEETHGHSDARFKGVGVDGRWAVRLEGVLYGNAAGGFETSPLVPNIGERIAEMPESQDRWNMSAKGKWRGRNGRGDKCEEDEKTLGGIEEGVEKWEGKRDGVVRIHVRIARTYDGERTMITGVRNSWGDASALGEHILGGVGGGDGGGGSGEQKKDEKCFMEGRCDTPKWRGKSEEARKAEGWGGHAYQTFLWASDRPEKGVWRHVMRGREGAKGWNPEQKGPTYSNERDMRSSFRSGRPTVSGDTSPVEMRTTKVSSTYMNICDSPGCPILTPTSCPTSKPRREA